MPGVTPLRLNRKLDAKFPALSPHQHRSRKQMRMPKSLVIICVVVLTMEFIYNIISEIESSKRFHFRLDYVYIAILLISIVLTLRKRSS
jgi:hypothetical protein